MAYVMLVAAVITSILVTSGCFALKWRRVYIVAPLQFIAAFAVTYFAAARLARDRYAQDALLIALVISAAMPVLFLLLRLIVGRLDRRQPGGLIKRHQQRTGENPAN